MVVEVKSKYILKDIFKYIKDKTTELKLFAYSKYYQKRLEINIANYCKIYLDRLDFDLNKYIYRKEIYYKKDSLIKDYNNFFSEKNLNKEEFENILYIILNSKIEKEKKNYVNIESPIFEIISTTNDFDKYHMIIIYQETIDRLKLKDYYSISFDKLNKSNKKYSVFYIFNEKTKADDLLELNINFNNVKKVNFGYSDYKPINNEISEKSKNIFKLFQDLEELILSGNSNIIKVLETIYFKELRSLQLSWNEISNIKLLEKVRFDKLELLNLSHNLISDINILENINLNQLKVLDLSFNKISDVEVLRKVKFNKLEKLDLCYNEIFNIIVLESDNFKELKELNLYHNKISDINVLKDVKFDNLEILNLGCNLISDISILENVSFKQLKELNLSFNEILSINVLEKVKFDKLKILNLNGNNLITSKCNSSIISRLRFEIYNENIK